MTRTATDDLYVELGYYTPENYTTYTAEADANPSVTVTVTADGGKIKSADATLSVTATQASTGSKVVEAEAAFTEAFSPTITASVTRVGEIVTSTTATFTSTPSVTRTSDVTLATLVNLSLQGDKLVQGAASASSSTTLTADAIAYPLAYSRPNDFVGYFYDNSLTSWSVDSGAYVYSDAYEIEGTHAIGILDPDTTDADDRYAIKADLPAISIGENEDFVLSFYFRNLDTFANSNHTIVLSFGRTFPDMNGGSLSSDANRGAINIGLRRQNAGNRAILFALIRQSDNSNIQLGLGSSKVDTLGQGLRITVRRRNGDTIELMNGNTVIGSATYSGALYANCDQIALFRPEANGDVYYDKFIFKVGTSGDLLPSTSGNFYNDDYTVVKAGFNQTLADDTVNFIRDGEAAFDTTASLTASAGSTIGADANLAAVSTTLADAQKIAGASADVSSTATLVSTAELAPFEFDSAMSSTSSVSAEASVIKSAESSINSQFDQSTTVLRLLNFDISTESIATSLSVVAKTGNFIALLDVVSQITVLGEKTTGYSADFAISSNMALTALNIKQLASDLSSLFAQTADAVKITSTSASVSSEFATSATSTRIKSLAADLFSTASMELDTGKITDFASAQSSSFGVTADVGAIRETGSTQTVQATLAADPIKAVDASSTQSSLFTQTTTGLRIKDFAVDTDSIATQLAAVAKTGDFFVNSESQFIVNCEATSIGSGEIVLNAQFTQTTQDVRVRFADSDMAAVAQHVTSGDRTRSTPIDMSSTATVDVTAQSQLLVTADLTAFTSVAAAVDKIRSGVAALASTTAVTTQPNITRSFEVDAGSLFTPSVIAGVQADAIIALVAEFSVQANTSILHVDQIVYTIPSETRTHTITNETRTHTVHRETRSYTIEGA